jgi:hypothetical protein
VRRLELLQASLDGIKGDIAKKSKFRSQLKDKLKKSRPMTFFAKSVQYWGLY